jgi:hypothetical protein
MATNYRDRMYIYNDIHDALITAQLHRGERKTYDVRSGEFEWTKYERQIAADKVNEFRNLMNKSPVEQKRIDRAESSASGHVDYTQKFALCCMELVFE